MKNSLIGLAIITLIFAGSLTMVESHIVFSKGFHMTTNTVIGSSIVINPTTGNLKDAISQYDEVILEPGVYTGEKNRNITIPDGRNVYVHSKNNLNNVVIDASGLSNIFTVKSTSTLRLDYITFKNGLSENGGAIESNGSLIMNNCSLENNKASSNGGAIFMTLLNLNNSKISNTEFINNTATSSGGSIFINGHNTSFKIENSIIKDSNSGKGAGICFWSDNFTITAENIRLSNNKALTNDSQQDGIGGGIEIYGDFNFNLIKSVIQSNKANLGAGIYASGGSNQKSKMMISNCNIENNEALNYGEGYIVNSAYGGAGIASLYFDTYLQNSNLTRNNASYYKDLDPSGDEIGNNRGGGYYNYNGDVTLDNCRFEDNFAYNGGGLDTRYGTFTISNSLFRNNLATYGGGVYTCEGNITLKNSALSNNTVSMNGGGIYNLNGSTTIEKCNITSNVAVDNGG
ncbi:MAG: hypothetical protein LBD03_00135, partial [Methanobrevibacter sp.]|nr:hypothetical protein [Candidatus Methanovirga procula]